MPAYKKIVKVPGHSAQELYDKVSADIDRFLTKASVGKFEVTRDPSTREVKVKSPMFSATLFCEEETVRLDGSLSLMATPFRSKIDEGIDRWIAKTFQTGQPGGERGQA
jgi:hypothetical protein